MRRSFGVSGILHRAVLSLLTLSTALVPASETPRRPGDLARPGLAAQREELFRAMRAELDLRDDQLAAVRRIFERSSILGQGNPLISVHPMTRDECRTIRKGAVTAPADLARCRARNMVPVYDPTVGQSADDARACIDQFEFPDIPCEYPVVHVSARESVELCEAVGKRICDAHEWEGACAGAVRDPESEYAWGQERLEMRWLHNVGRERVWAYGPTKDHSLCATGSHKSPGCTGGGYERCGSNTYPAGAFPACVSPFGVYDQHGNVAEHMNLPLRPDELASRGGYGWTEMKGSWFIFASYEAHPDDCRWRAPDWHGSRITSLGSHSNYHLGFRCCKSISP
jgi:formylglycine-generating enzyme required for sulfatase activity